MAVARRSISSSVTSLESAYGDSFASDDARHFRSRVVHVSYQDRFRGTDHYAGRFETHINPMRAEIAFLG